MPLRIAPLWDSLVLEEEMEKELQRSFCDGSGPLTRAILFHARDRSVVMFATHHSSMDGKSHLLLVQDLLASVAGEDLGEPLEVQPGLGQLLGLPLPAKYVKKLEGRSVATEVGTGVELPKVRVQRLQLGVEETGVLLERAKEEGTTVHGALTLAGKSYSEEWNALPVRCMSTIDMRRTLGIPDAAGVLFSSYLAARVGLFHTQPADKLLDVADVVVVVGYNPIEYEPGLWNRDKSRDLIHVDVVPADIDKDYKPRLELTGDIAATIEELATRLEGEKLPANSALLAEIVQDRALFVQRAATLNGVPIHPMRLVQELQGLLSDDMTVCLDMGSFHIWLARYLYSFRPRQILMTNGQQTLGVGLPWAIAACLVRPNEKVISISGDGGFLFSAMELETAVRLKCNLVHLVWIDGSYDMVGFQEVAKYGRTSGVDFGPVDVVRFAEAFGAKGLRIETPDRISSTIKKALAMQGPVIVGVPVDYRDNHQFMEIVHPNALN
jgi:acetolactate synthase I/II/III large subunit